MSCHEVGSKNRVILAKPRRQLGRQWESTVDDGDSPAS
jgi:hypothetical protein